MAASLRRVNQPVRRQTPSQKRASRRAETWTFRVTACVAAVLAVAAPAVWFAGRTGTIPASTVPAPGRALLSSNPAGSSVFIDGVESGTTPLTATLPAGPHTIEYRYRKNTRKIELTVVAGEDVSSVVDWTKKPPAARRARPATKPAGVRSPTSEAGNVKPEASSVEPNTGSQKPEANSAEPVRQ